MNKPLFNLMLLAVSVFALSVALLIWGLYQAGARLNTTRSVPVGLYWTTQAPIQRGSLVEFCPTAVGVFQEARNRGYISAGPCPGGFGLMMKQVAGVSDDRVRITPSGVWVNQDLAPLSAPLNADRAGRPMPRYQATEYTLGNQELLLMSPVSATSFDGRYFGPVAAQQVRSVIRPVFTW